MGSSPIMKSPYDDIPQSAFWSKGVANASPFKLDQIFRKKWDIGANDKIATAGSCFAQHISRYMRKAGFNLMDVEPPPPWSTVRVNNTVHVGTIATDDLAQFGYQLY